MVPAYYVKDYKRKEDYNKGRDDMFKLMLVIAIVGIISSFLVLILYKKRPITPPSKTGEEI